MDCKLIEALQRIVGECYVLTDDADLQFYGCDRTSQWQSRPSAIVLPANIEQVQSVVRLANEKQFSIVPSGGRTGLSGGAVATDGEIVLALDRMNRILEVNAIDETIHCEAGAITQNIQSAAEQAGLYYPVDFASSGSSQIGGNVATNAGGIKVIRYGMTRNWVLGLRVVTGSGEILNLNKGLVKNNTGYDLRQLFIGSEGTLGIICEATMALTKPEANCRVVVLAVNDFPSVVSLLSLCKTSLQLTAYEFMSQQAVEAVIEESGVPSPFKSNIETPFYVLLEYLNEGDSDQQIERVFEQSINRGWVKDAVVSQSDFQSKGLWSLRENISETLSQYRPYKNDISVRVSKLPQFIGDVESLIMDNYKDYKVVWYGHIGDGNLHLNIIKPKSVSDTEFTLHCHNVSERLAKLIERYEGSISAEHGVGLLKKSHLSASRSEDEIALMRQLKKLFDPKGLLNPGKIFD